LNALPGHKAQRLARAKRRLGEEYGHGTNDRRARESDADETGSATNSAREHRASEPRTGADADRGDDPGPVDDRQLLDLAARGVAGLTGRRDDPSQDCSPLGRTFVRTSGGTWEEIEP
jgi:hypothetical protein